MSIKIKTPLRHILIARHDAIGDLILTLPAIAAIKSHFPDTKITVMTTAYNRDIIAHLPYIDEILVKPATHSFPLFIQFVKQLRSLKVDLMIHFRMTTEVAWAGFFGARHNIGDKSLLGLWPIFRRYGVFYRNHNRMNHVSEYNGILLKSLGISSRDCQELAYTPPPGAIPLAKRLLASLGPRKNIPLICIHIGVGFGNRPIRANKYVEYIHLLRSQMDVDIYLSCYTDAEIAVCKEIQSQVKGPLLTAYRQPIQTYIGLLSLMDLFVSVDTGPFHLAAALKIPQLAIFPSKKVKPLSWGPFRNRHLICRNPYQCHHDCPHQQCPYDICSDDISVIDMVNKTQALLKGEGVSQQLEQREYWAQHSLSILVLYDEKTEDQARQFYQQLQSWSFVSFISHVTKPDLYPFARQRDISVIHNFSGKRRGRLFWMTQRLISTLFFSPLLIHGPHSYESLTELMATYQRQYGKKLL
ncbi:MAG: hypothetical protein CL521_01830 [Actinobacteria bacterium]|nr:hypothetical protein [Actinomycetota bacterium]